MAVSRTVTSNRKNPSKGRPIKSKSGPIGRNSPGRLTTVKIKTVKGAAKGRAGGSSG